MLFAGLPLDIGKVFWRNKQPGGNNGIQWPADVVENACLFCQREKTERADHLES